jgi:hypothetical protein
MTHHPQRKAMPDVRLWTGIAAFAVAILTATEFSVQVFVVGARPSLDDEVALVDFMTRTSTGTLLTILIDTMLMAALIVFLAGFRQLITHSEAALQWVADLAYGAGLVFVAVTLVGDAMEAGTALDVTGMAGNYAVLRALTVGHTILFGSIGCVLTALVAAASGYVTLGSNALPPWTGWLAYVVALLNLAAVPTMFGGTDPASFLAAGGAGTALFATFPWLVWVTAVGIVTVRDRRRPFDVPRQGAVATA